MSTTMHRPLQLLQKAVPAMTAGHPHGPSPAVSGWLLRLACWAERQPPQHRLGGLDAYRHF